MQAAGLVCRAGVSAEAERSEGRRRWRREGGREGGRGVVKAAEQRDGLFE